MNESITSKISRLINGSLHNFVNSMAKMAPDMVIDETIREIDDVISEAKVEIGQLIAKQHLMHKQKDTLTQQHDALTHNISIALTAGRDDLIEVAIAKQLEIEAHQQALILSMKECCNQEQQIQNYLSNLNNKKQNMEQERLHLKSIHLEHNDQTKNRQKTKVIHAESVFNQILRESSHFDKAPLLFENMGQLNELEQLSQQDTIQKRLAQLKSKKE